MTFRLVLDPPPIDTPRVLFDLSRLWRREKRPFGTGVDRIDLALGLGLLNSFGPNCLFVHATRAGPALIPHRLGRALLEGLEHRWGGQRSPARSAPRALTEALGRARGAIGGWQDLATPDTTYVNACHSGLPLRPRGLDRIDPHRRMRRLAYIHDLIPIEFPEYQTPRGRERLARFLSALASAPIRFLTNSADTARRLRAHIEASGWQAEAIETLTPRVIASIQPAETAAMRQPLQPFLQGHAPYFIAIGTIEPRKNHLLLLNLWRELAAEGCTQHLVVVGRRGWENEMVVDMLERCSAIAPHVTEFGDLNDNEMIALLARARALLMPSFAEGLCLPVLEAGAIGTPVIVSDLPALREIAPAGTVFLNPLDGPSWKREVLSRAA